MVGRMTPDAPTPTATSPATDDLPPAVAAALAGAADLTGRRMTTVASGIPFSAITWGAPDDRPLARLELLEATCTLKFVEVAIGEAQFDEIGQRQQKVLVTITDVPPGTHNGSIIVRTNITEYAELRVPLQVSGLSRSDEHPPRK